MAVSLGTIEGYRELLAVFNRLPKEANAALRDAAGQVARTQSQRMAAAASTRQARAVSGSMRVRRDRYPSIVIGGKKRVAAGRGPQAGWAGSMVFGTEYGGGSWRFPTADPWIWPSVRGSGPQVVQELGTAAQRILDIWAD